MADQAEALFEYTLRLGDSTLILAQRLSEWCGHGPALEEDLAMTNVALDLLGQARLLLAYAGELEAQGRDEDALAYHRDALDFHNLLLVEQPNDDFGQTIVRQFLFDAFALEFYECLANSSNTRLSEIAAKSVKETRYHIRHSAQWLIRLGDGTEESHMRAQRAVDGMWMFTGELFAIDDIDECLVAAGIAVDLAAVKPAWDARVNEVFTEATLQRPDAEWMQSGGKQGRHTEHLGYILAELQFLPRAYPDATAW